MASRPIHLMIVAAHPADSFDQAGGTLAHHVAQGDRVTAVIATTGVRSHHFRLADEKRRAGKKLNVEKRIQKAVAEKLEEVRNACRILGFDDVRALGFDDDDVLLTQGKVEAIAAVIRELKPDILITHHPFECGGFKMHGTIGQATLHAWQLASGSGHGRQPRHYAPIVYFMCPLAYIGNNSLEYAGTARADLFVDITDVIELKVRAMDYINTQYYGGAYARKTAESFDGTFGQHAGVAYAEVFQRFAPAVRYTLPVTDAELSLIDAPIEAYMARRSEMTAALLPLPPNQRFSAQHRFTKEMYRD